MIDIKRYERYALINEDNDMIGRAMQLAAELRNEIREGRYALGDRLPPERDLMLRSGYSRGTVRKALNILAEERLVVRQHGRGTFVADPAHARMQSSEIALIAIMVVEREYYFEPIIQAASTQAGVQGYVMATGTNASGELEEQHINAFLHNGVRGVILTPRGDKSLKNYLRLREAGVAVVLLDMLIPEHSEDTVLVDNRQGTFLAAQHLAALGHRRIAYIGHDGNNDLPCRPERLRGWRDACRNLGLSTPEEYILETNLNEADEHLSQLLRSGKRPTAFVCYNDTWAVKVINTARTLGLSVPEDLSVVGFDDCILASGHDLPITSINPEHAELGISAVKMLIAKIESARERPKRTLSIRPRLVVRKSTRRLD